MVSEHFPVEIQVDRPLMLDTKAVFFPRTYGKMLQTEAPMLVEI